MGIMLQTFTLRPRQRLALSVLVGIFAITGSRVEFVMAAMPEDVQAAVVSQETVFQTLDDEEMGIRISPSYFGTLPAAKKIPAVSTYYVEMTAYNSEIGQTDDSPFITANGTRVRDGIVATNFLRFNTRIRIPDLYGDKIFLVTDRMNARYATRVDIWMEQKSQAIQFGLKRNIRIEVL